MGEMVLPGFFTRGDLTGVAALVAFVLFRLEDHLILADRTDDAGARTHITALQAVVEPAMFVDIQKDIAAAAGTTFSFPFRHFIYSIFKPARAD